MTYFLTGYIELNVPQTQVADFLELCRCQGLVYSGFVACADGSVILRMKKSTAQKALAAASRCGFSIRAVKEGGLPKLMGLILRRPGLWIGALLAIALITVSSRFVWDIRVSGNERLTERRVEETLRACGFGVGSYLGHFKADRTENQALMINKELAWISVNVKGTVAYVQIRETLPTPTDNPQTPANMIADTGGQIVRVELEKGNVLVTAGQWVGKGDLLISGLYDSDQLGFRYTHAEGRVFARVVEEITVTVPLTYTKKLCDPKAGEIKCEKSLIFFENRIKFSKKDFNSDGSCDIIKRVSVPFSDWGVDFPISMVTEWYIPYTETEVKRTYAEADALAYHELAKRIASIPGGAEVLSKTVTTTLGEDMYILSCTLECIRDIAKEQTFEVLP